MAVTPPYCGCPAGFTPSADLSTCVQITTVAATASPTIYTVGTGNQLTVYGSHGANFYNDATGRPLPISVSSNTLVDATSVVLPIASHVVSTLWGDGTALMTGRLNQVGVWTTSPPTSSGDVYPLGEYIGFTVCINVPTTGLYYIGIGADNVVRFKVNGVIVVQLADGSSFSFGNWHVIPYTLQAGLNIIEVEGANANGPAAFGAEIYNYTTSVAALAAMTTQAQLTAATLFSSYSKIGQSFQTGQFSGYTCPTGYALSTCNGAPSCSLITRQTYNNCCSLLTNCQTGATILTLTDLTAYTGKIITLMGVPGCWTISTSAICTGAVPVTVVQGYADCNTCLPKCYLLTDCANVEPPITTNTDLSAYIGQVVKISGCKTECWVVSQTVSCTNSVPVKFVKSFATCLLCNPPIVIPSPALLHSRKVKPGYNTAGCTPAYTERINCAFAEQVYNIIKKKRYGITVCCDIEYSKYLIKKELLDLNAIFDPLACQPACTNVVPPCAVSASVIVFTPTSCAPPTGVTAVIVVPVIPCVDASGPGTATIVVNNIS